MARLTIKYTIGVLIFISVFMYCSEGFCQDMRVSVCVFKNLTTNPEDDWMGVGLADSIILNIGRKRGLQVVELEQLNKLIDAMKLSYSGMTDEATTTKIGKLLGIQYLVVGNYQSRDHELIVNYRMVEVETGKILFSDMVKGKSADIIEVEENVGKNIIQNMKSRWPELKITPDDYKKPVSEMAHVNYTKAIMCSLKSNIREALECYENVITEDPANGDSYLGQGELYLKAKNTIPALERFNRALCIYKGKKDKFFTGRANYCIAETYYLQGDYERSAGYYKDALELKIENDFNAPLIYSRLSELAHKKGQLTQAIKLAKKALKENTKLENKYVRVELLINLAKLLKENKHSGPAKEAFKDALAVSKEIEYPKMEELYKMEIGGAQNTK